MAPKDVSRLAQITVALAPLPILATFIAIKFGFPRLYDQIIQEDQVLENLQFLLYMAACATGFLAARRFRLAGMRCPAIAWYLFSAAALLVAFEEVSWFQRVVVFRFDLIQSSNAQNETNIHNLSIVQPHLHVFYAAVAGVGARNVPAKPFTWSLEAVVKPLQRAVPKDHARPNAGGARSGRRNSPHGK